MGGKIGLKLKGAFLVVFVATIAIPLVSAANATLTGGLVFVIATAIVGFFAWLFGSEHIRSVALNCGFFAGGMVWAVMFVYRIDKSIAVLRKGLQELRVRSSLEDE